MGVCRVLLIHFLQFLIQTTALGALYRLNICSLQKLFVCEGQHPLLVIFLVLKCSNLLSIHGATKVFQNFNFTRAFEIAFFQSVQSKVTKNRKIIIQPLQYYFQFIAFFFSLLFFFTFDDDETKTKWWPRNLGILVRPCSSLDQSPEPCEEAAAEFNFR